MKNIRRKYMNKRIKKKKAKQLVKLISNKMKEEGVFDNYVFENNKVEIILDLKTLRKVN